MEGRINFQNKLNHKPLVRVSEQQILSCTWDLINGDLGCDGGDPSIAINKIITLFGGKVPLESKSPYLGMEGLCEESAWTSQYGLINGSITINASLDLPTRVTQMKEALT